MNDTTLEFNVVIKADETILQNIHQMLVRNPGLFDKLAMMLKHTLESAVLTNHFDIHLQHDHLVDHHVVEPVEWR